MTYQTNNVIMYQNNTEDYSRLWRGHQLFSILELCTKDERAINRFKNDVEWLVCEENYSSFYDLCETEKYNIVGLLLAALDDPTEWFVNTKNADSIMRYFGKYLCSFKVNDKEHYLNLLKAEAIKHFSEYLDQYIQEQHHQIHQDKLTETDSQYDYDQFMRTFG